MVEKKALIRLDQVYDLIEGNIGSDIRAKIISIPSKVKHPLAQAVAKVVCLLQFAKTVHRTAENIAAALVDRVDADSRLTEVHEALTELEKGLMFRQGEGGYRQIKERKIAPRACDLKPNANGPNVLGLEWLFLPDE